MRSPLLGYNHNVKYGGHIFHVQTEDSGPVNPHIFTHLFYEGSILASMREKYDPETPEDKVRLLMQAQHKSILKELKRSSYDERIMGFFSTRGLALQPAEESAQPAEPAAVPQPADAQPPAARPDVLDLDTLPAAAPETSRTPEPLPGHVRRPATVGPGSYTLRRPPNDALTPTPSPQPARPRPATRPVGSRPVVPVIVQRQVVVGTSPVTSPRKPTTTPVRRRPAAAAPFVVKEGSHISAPVPPAANWATNAPKPIAPVDELRDAPRTAGEAPIPTAPLQDSGSVPSSGSQEAIPAAFVSEQSLDEVILAYLSQGELKK